MRAYRYIPIPVQATYRLKSTADDKQKRENAVLEKSIEVFKLKASADAMKDRMTAGAAEVAALKEGATKASAKLLKAQKAVEKAKAAYVCFVLYFCFVCF